MIEKDNLQVIKELSTGHFGIVSEALHTTTGTESRVAVKSLRDMYLNNAVDVAAFFKEALIMKDFDHPNVLRLFGVSIRDGKPLVVVPLMTRGSSLTLIRDPDSGLKHEQLIGMIIDIAKGMSYLESRNIIHRDLAARNCLVDEDMSVKVSDFGLSRDIYKKKYYRWREGTVMPIHWMAPEAIRYQRMTTKSDVWSFGIVMWEIMSKEQTPYALLNTFMIDCYVMDGKRLGKPDACSDPLFQIMLECWAQDPSARPTFVELIDDITDL